MNNQTRPKPVVLIILDGWGVAPPWGGNAVTQAKTPAIDKFLRTYSSTTIQASGEAVGLPPQEFGNSEIGHLNIGAGRIVRKDLPAITQMIKDGSFFKNKILMGTFMHATEFNSNVHIMGLVSNGGVHSHETHLFALLDLAKRLKFNNVYIHIFTDGRDTEPSDALTHLNRLEKAISRYGVGRIVTVMGRYFAMDRDHRWPRTKAAFEAMIGKAKFKANNARSAISAGYRRGETDEFISPTMIESPEAPFVGISENDSVIFFNFRSDRARQIIYALVKPDFDRFWPRPRLENLYFTTFTYHESDENLPIHMVISPKVIQNGLAAVIAASGMRQLHIAETEKYAHVTYFFNGGFERKLKGEDRILVPSPKVATYDKKPEMSARQVAKETVKAVEDGHYDFIVVNFANADMVGHSGNLKATVTGCEVVDDGVSRISKAVMDMGGAVVITGDHGNAESMVDSRSGKVSTEHALSPVPFIVVCDRAGWQHISLKNNGILANVAPTILQIMGLPRPSEMTESLINAPDTNNQIGRENE